VTIHSRAIGMVRLKSKLWVQAHLRKCNDAGLPAMLVQRGNEDAGSIFIKLNYLNGTANVYGAAPGGAHDENGERRWSQPLGENPLPESEIDEYLQRQRKYDPDFWVIEIEDSMGRVFLDNVLSD